MTGCAAVLAKGLTLHSAIKSKKESEYLMVILVIDKISFGNQ